MEGEEGEDPFSSLENLCEITASQEEILLNCRFSGEHDKYLDPNPVSSPLTASQQSSITSEVQPVIMVTPPESDCSRVDKSITEEDEEDTYLTPREHSLSDDPQQLPLPLAESDVRGGGKDGQALAVGLGEDGEGEEENRGFQLDTKLEGFEGDVDMGREEDNLGRGFGAILEALSGNVSDKKPGTVVGDGEDEVMGNKAVDFGDEGETEGILGVQLNANSNGKDGQALGVGLGEDIEGEEEENRGLQLDKKLEDFEGDFDMGIEEDYLELRFGATSEALFGNVSEKQPGTVVGDGEDELMLHKAVDFGDEGETEGVSGVQFNTNSNGKFCDCVVKDHEMEKVDVDSEESDGKLGHDKQRVVNILESAEEALEGDSRDSEEIEDCCRGNISWSLLENSHKNGLTCEGCGLNGKVEKQGKNGKRRSRYSKCEELCENDDGGVRTSEGRKLLKDGGGSDGICRGECLSRNSEEAGEFSKDDEGNCDSGSSEVCEAGILRMSAEKVLREAEKVNDNLKHISCINEMLMRGKKRGVSREKAPPLPILDQRTDTEGVSERMKGGPLTEALDVLEYLVKKPDHGSECDFLETAKRKGMVFPRPRWWPPEMND